MTVLKRGLVIALAALLISGMGLGCSNQKANTMDTDQPPATTHSSYSTGTTGTSAPPAETYVEPPKSWGEDTRKNLEKGPGNE